MKIAIVHYYLVSVRGGERCFLTLAETFPEADLFAVVLDPASQPAWLSERGVKTSFLQKVPGSKKYFRQFFMFYPYAVEQFDLSGYDLVISSSAGFTHGVLTGPETCHICYCYNTFRYAWNWHYDFMASNNPIARLFLGPLLSWVRTWDVAAAQRVDYFSAISAVTQQRIKKYYRRESTIIHPPVDMSKFNILDQAQPGDYFLAVSELVPYKKTDIVVEAFNQLGYPLLVVGDGPQRESLQKLAKSNVRFLGRIPDAELNELYNGCRALVFMAKEDYGIVPLEAQAAGRPVIAYGAGGVLETVVANKTGIFFARQDVGALLEAIACFEKMTFDRQIIKAHAETFGVAIFQERILAFVQEKLAEHRCEFGLPAIAELA